MAFSAKPWKSVYSMYNIIIGILIEYVIYCMCIAGVPNQGGTPPQVRWRGGPGKVSVS